MKLSRTGPVVAATVTVADDPAADTRSRVARLLHEDGPATAAGLADRLGITGTAVRRHLDALVAGGTVESSERAPYGPTARRGRGRPAKVFALTDSGRDAFRTDYDVLAVAALQFLAEQAGDDAVAAFARSRIADLETRLAQRLENVAVEDRARVLAEALSDEGFAASTALTPGSDGVQVCQHHCPVAHVAEQFPQLCEAETEAFARLLGTHVQRLATIAHGDGVCTTYVPTTSLLDQSQGRPGSERTSV